MSTDVQCRDYDSSTTFAAAPLGGDPPAGGTPTPLSPPHPLVITGQGVYIKTWTPQPFFFPLQTRRLIAGLWSRCRSLWGGEAMNKTFRVYPTRPLYGSHGCESMGTVTAKTIEQAQKLAERIHGMAVRLELIKSKVKA